MFAEVDTANNDPADRLLPAMQVASFTGVGCKGNSHWVTITCHSAGEQQWQRLSSQLAPAILVVVQPPAKGCAYARFFHYGKPVFWCGSGILAAAKALQENAMEAEAIVSASACYQVLRRGEHLGFVTRTPMLWQPPQSTAFWRKLFGSVFVCAWQSAEKQGYTLVELNSAEGVRKWRARLQAIQQHSARALILTAKARPRANCDYVMRYFAPQYGNNEDAATGSANALLMPYWAQRLNRQCLKGRQVSSAGGVFYGRKLGDKAFALYGATQLLSRAQLPLPQ